MAHHAQIADIAKTVGRSAGRGSSAQETSSSAERSQARRTASGRPAGKADAAVMGGYSAASFAALAKSGALGEAKAETPMPSLSAAAARSLDMILLITA